MAQPDTDAKLTPEQVEKIVDSNDSAIRRDMFKSAWKIRSQTLWSGGIVGLAAGAAVGLATGIAGAIAMASSAVILPVVGAMAVTGMLTGVLGFTAVASPISSVSGGIKVKERADLQNDPAQGLQNHQNYKAAAEKETFWNRIIPFTKGSEKIINWKNALIFGAAGLALGGLLLATGGSAIVLGAAAHVAGGALTHSAMAAMTLTAGASFGAFFGVDIPTIGANVTEFIGNIFAGKKSGAADTAHEVTCAPQISAHEKITQQEAAQLNVRLSANAGDKSFTQTVTTQQLQAGPATLQA